MREGGMEESGWMDEWMEIGHGILSLLYLCTAPYTTHRLLRTLVWVTTTFLLVCLES